MISIYIDLKNRFILSIFCIEIWLVIKKINTRGFKVNDQVEKVLLNRKRKEDEQVDWQKGVLHLENTTIKQ